MEAGAGVGGGPEEGEGEEGPMEVSLESEEVMSE